MDAASDPSQDEVPRGWFAKNLAESGFTAEQIARLQAIGLEAWTAGEAYDDFAEIVRHKPKKPGEAVGDPHEYFMAIVEPTEHRKDLAAIKQFCLDIEELIELGFAEEEIRQIAKRKPEAFENTTSTAKSLLELGWDSATISGPKFDELTIDAVLALISYGTTLVDRGVSSDMMLQAAAGPNGHQNLYILLQDEMAEVSGGLRRYNTRPLLVLEEG